MVQEGKKRLPGPFILCLSGLSEPPPLFYPQERSDEEAHQPPAESEVFHGNQQRRLKEDYDCLILGMGSIPICKFPRIIE
jgi:hypothetical protein